ncbi:hypothetical protein O3M35_000662 [Rhynocoris fuscipes]|uniref:Uncharacterized protein n=1 Tax=Rhynocoris fuscipes TaxID=488301 RepID=A0AAW1DN62_9HEMI
MDNPDQQISKDIQKMIDLSSLKPEDLLPESPEIQRNLQHLLTDVEVMVGLKCHRLGYGNIQEVAVP